MKLLSLFSEILSITDVIMIAVFLVAIGIGVLVAFRESRHHYGEYTPDGPSMEVTHGTRS
jgi:hypothetical protein